MIVSPLLFTRMIQCKLSDMCHTWKASELGEYGQEVANWIDNYYICLTRQLNWVDTNEAALMLMH